MCIICLEFNKTFDRGDAQKMIEAARREANVIPEKHLKKIEKEIEEMDENQLKPLEVE